MDFTNNDKYEAENECEISKVKINSTIFTKPGKVSLKTTINDYKMIWLNGNKYKKTTWGFSQHCK